jgi:hypothetical protein
LPLYNQEYHFCAWISLSIPGREQNGVGRTVVDLQVERPGVFALALYRGNKGGKMKLNEGEHDEEIDSFF